MVQPGQSCVHTWRLYIGAWVQPSVLNPFCVCGFLLFQLVLALLTVLLSFPVSHHLWPFLPVHLSSLSSPFLDRVLLYVAQASL